MLMMDDSPVDQYAPFGHHPHAHFSTQDHLQVPSYFDFDLMKRAHESSVQDSSNKKPRWSPGSSIPGASTASGLNSSTSSDSSTAAAQAAANAAKYANYGYGPNAPHHQAAILASQQQGHALHQQQQAHQHTAQQQGMYGHVGLGQNALQGQQHLAMPGYNQQAAALYNLNTSIPSITSAAAAQQQQVQQPLQGHQPTAQQQQQQQSINGTYTAPASPFAPSPANGASPSPAAGFNFNGSPMNLAMMGMGMQGLQQMQQMQQMQNMQGMQGMGGMMGMNGNYGGNMGVGLGMGMGMNAFGGYGYDMSMGNKLVSASPFYGQGNAMNPMSGGALNPNQRTVYIGNLPSAGTVDELLSLVRSTGPIEGVRLLPEKNCAFISFLDAPTALGFYNDATMKKLQLHGMELKIGWGKATPMPPTIAAAVMQYNASRNVYLGGLEDYITEDLLREDLGRFGPVDQVKLLKDKNVGFVHFLSIQSAIKAVSQLSQEPAWQGKRVNYGKDRCTYVPKGQQQKIMGMGMGMGIPMGMGMQPNGMPQQSLIPASTIAAAVNMGQNIPFNPTPPAAQQQFMQMPGSNVGSPFPGAGAAPNMRTVYLGNIHPDTTAEDLCNAVRGGVLQSVRYMKDKHIAFVTFIDPAAALAFFNVASIQGLSVNNRRLKIGWGKSTNPLPPALAAAVQGGATRNVYVGNIDDWEKWSEERLKRDFGEFGDIELINSLKEKNCAWVNFTNISSAMKAIEAMRIRPEYSHLRVSYGKDRCANPPRAGVQGGGSRRNNGTTPGTNGINGMGTETSPPHTTSGSAEPGELSTQAAGTALDAQSPGDEYDYVYDDGLLDGEDEADAREAEHDIIVPADEAALATEAAL